MTNHFHELNPPKHITVYQTASNLAIIRKWLNSSTFFFIGFALVWISFFLSMVGIILSSRVATEFVTGNPIVLFIFGLFLLTAIYFLYILIAILLNRTYILANNEKIIVRHKPIPVPWFNDKTVRTANLERLYAKKVATYQNPGQDFGYEIYTSTNTGSTQSLLMLSTRKETVFIEQKLEHYYQIEDEAQKGEIGVSNPTQNAKPELRQNQAKLKEKLNTNQINIPKSIKVYQTDDGLIFTQKWGSIGLNIYITFFTTLCNGFLLFFTIVMASSTNTSGDIWVIFILLPLCLLIGFLLIYFTLALWLNKLYIIASNEKIIIRDQPIPFPWNNNKQLRVANLERLYSKKRVTMSPGKSVIYEVRVNTYTGADKQLVGFSKSEEALFIEQILEDYLNIKDEPREGEISIQNPRQV